MRASAPKPYAQVIPSRAVSDTGGITVHRVDERWFFQVPDSLIGRDFLLVGRVAATPANFGVYILAGASVHEPPRPVGDEGEGPPPPLLLAPLNVPRSDLPALARSELTAIRAQAVRSAASAPAGVQRAHWADVAARVDEILDPDARPATTSR